MQLLIGVLFWIRLLTVFCFCTFECGGKHFIFPFGLITLIWPVGVVEFFIFLFTDVQNPDFKPLSLLVGSGGIFVVLYVFIPDPSVTNFSALTGAANSARLPCCWCT